MGCGIECGNYGGECVGVMSDGEFEVTAWHMSHVKAQRELDNGIRSANGSAM